MRTLLRSCVFTGLSLALALPAAASSADVPPPPVLQQGIEVQARGPVHEAFAQPTPLQPEPGPLVPNAPPGPVPEEPPDQSPEGRNVQWIGGYWAWDADRNEFLWVSGTYRDAPPGRHFVPGYWENAADGWRWVPGFWGPDAQAELPYVPQPPAPPDANGPSVPPPDDNNFYNPGSWAYQQEHYVWRPGSWQPYQPGWVWVPAQYVCTPAGYQFVSGYWDYPLENRGLLFAPVCFTQPLWQTPGWAYQPAYAVGCGPLLNAFFVGPRRHHYYFGDYYGNGYQRAGYSPWFNNGPRYHDPLFGYARWHNRGNPGWQGGLRQVYLDRQAGRAPLPPRTLGQQSALLRQTPGAGNLRLVAPISQFRGPNVRVARLSAAQLGVQRTNAQRLRQVGLTRGRTETARSLRQSGSASRTPRPQGSPSQSARPAMTAHAPGLTPRSYAGVGGMPGSGPSTHPRTTTAWPGHTNPHTLPATSSRAAPVAPRVNGAPSRSPAVQARRPPAPQYRAAVNHTRPTPAQRQPTAPAHAAPRPQSAPVHRTNVAHARPAAPAAHAAPAHRPAPAPHAAPVAHRPAPANHAAPAHHPAPAHGGGGHGHH